MTDSDNQWSIIGDINVDVAHDALAAAVVFNLNNWPAGDKQAGEIPRFLKNAAAVVAKVEHDAVNFLLVKTLE